MSATALTPPPISRPTFVVENISHLQQKRKFPQQSRLGDKRLSGYLSPPPPSSFWSCLLRLQVCFIDVLPLMREDKMFHYFKLICEQSE